MATGSAYPEGAGFCGWWSWWAGLAIAAVLVGSARAQEMRTWTDATGKYKVQAKFVELVEGKVTLERADGKRVVVPLDRLSEADRKYVADLGGQKNPFEEAAPAKPKGLPKMAAGGEQAEGQGEAEGAGEPKTVTPRWSQAQQVFPAPREEQWKLSISAPELPSGGRSRPIALPPKSDFFERTTTMVINPACQRAVIGYLWERGGPRGEGRTRVVLCDLAGGKVLGSATESVKMVPLALDDGGTKVLMRREGFGLGNQDQLELWHLTPSGIQRLLQWVPHDEARVAERDVKWAAFASRDTLVTQGGGKLTVWNAATVQPLYWINCHRGCVPALSPDRKYVAFAGEREVGILDLQAGEVVAFQPAPVPGFFAPVFAFTPKGTRLVCAASSRVFVWDTGTGSLVSEMPLSGGGPLVCPGENYALVGNTFLVDLEMQAKVWTYQGHGMVGVLGNVCWFVVASPAAGALIPATLPHSAAKPRIHQAMAAPDFFVLKPGTTVRINVSGLSDPGQREKVAAALREKLLANGCRVGEAGSVELVASTEAGKQREVGYRTFGQIGTRIYTMQEYISRLKLVWQGQTAWEVTGSNVPGFVHLQEGETLQEVLRRHESPNYAWFAQVELPKMVQKPLASGGTIGSSQVTAAGIQETSSKLPAGPGVAPPLRPPRSVGRQRQAQFIRPQVGRLAGKDVAEIGHGLAGVDGG